MKKDNIARILACIVRLINYNIIARAVFVVLNLGLITVAVEMVVLGAYGVITFDNVTHRLNMIGIGLGIAVMLVLEFIVAYFVTGDETDEY